MGPNGGGGGGKTSPSSSMNDAFNCEVCPIDDDDDVGANAETEETVATARRIDELVVTFIV